MRKVYSLYRAHQQKVFVLTDQALVSGTNFITSIIYARLLGLESFGAFVMGWMTILFVSNFQQAFIFSPMTNFYASLPDNKKEVYFQRLLVINLLFSMLCMLLIFIFNYIAYSFFHVSYLKQLVYTLPIAAFAYLSFDFQRKKLQLDNSSGYTLLFDVANTFLLTGIVILLYTSQSISIESIVLASAASYLSTTAFTFLNFRMPVACTLLSFEIISEHWRQGKWLLATALLQWLSGNYFMIAAAGLLGTKDIGIIRIAQNIVGVLNIIFIAMENYIPASASKIYKARGVRGLLSYLESLTFKGLLITISLCLVIMLCSQQIIGYLYGREYLPYGFVVRSFALFYILVFVAIPLRFAIKTLEHNHHIFIGYLISALFSILCANKLIHQYGLSGVIFGIFITQVLTQVWYIFSLKNYIYEYYSYSTWKS